MISHDFPIGKSSLQFPNKIKSSHQTTDGGSSTTGQACGFCLCSTDRFCLYSLGGKAKLLLLML